MVYFGTGEFQLDLELRVHDLLGALVLGSAHSRFLAFLRCKGRRQNLGCHWQETRAFFDSELLAL